MRFMVWLSLTLGRQLSRTVLHGIAVYFLLFSPKAGRASRAYLQRVLGHAPGLADRYRHTNPGFASDLYAAADRHELTSAD